MRTVSRYHPKPFFFRAWGLSQQGRLNMELYRPPHFVNEPPGYTPTSAKDLNTPQFFYRYTLFCLKPYPFLSNDKPSPSEE